jgi:hypothetical protein
MTDEHSILTADRVGGDISTRSRTAERVLNATITRADIGKS